MSFLEHKMCTLDELFKTPELINVGNIGDLIYKIYKFEKIYKFGITLSTRNSLNSNEFTDRICLSVI